MGAGRGSGLGRCSANPDVGLGRQHGRAGSDRLYNLGRVGQGDFSHDRVCRGLLDLVVSCESQLVGRWWLGGGLGLWLRFRIGLGLEFDWAIPSPYTATQPTSQPVSCPFTPQKSPAHPPPPSPAPPLPPARPPSPPSFSAPPCFSPQNGRLTGHRLLDPAQPLRHSQLTIVSWPQSLPRIISTVVFQGTRIVGTAFVQAYRQAARSKSHSPTRPQPSHSPAHSPGTGSQPCN